jgi:hypothetical protein
MTAKADKDLPKLLVKLADALAMDLTVFKNVDGSIDVEGVGDITIETHGYELNLKPTITDSKDYSSHLIHLMVHVGGDLYLSLIADNRDDSFTMFVVDGNIACLTKGDNSHLLYPNGEWSRYNLFVALEYAVTAVFQRKVGDVGWTKMGDGNSYVSAYIDAREEKEPYLADDKTCSAQ